MALRERFMMGGVVLPPLGLRGSPGDTWPEDGPARVSIVVAGNSGAKLRHIGGIGIVRFFAQRVVNGVPTGDVINITESSLFDADVAETLTVDLTAEFVARAGALNLREIGYIAVVATRGAGY